MFSLLPDRGAAKRIGAAFARKARDNIQKRSTPIEYIFKSLECPLYWRRLQGHKAGDYRRREGLDRCDLRSLGVRNDRELQPLDWDKPF